MKKLFALALVLAALLCGCGKNQVAAVKDLEFTYAEAEEAYALTFLLEDEQGQKIVSPAKVQLSIEDQEGNVLYAGKRKLEEADFIKETDYAGTPGFMGRLVFKKEELAPGKTLSGQVSISFKKTFSYSFQDLTCETGPCLPLMACKIQCKELGSRLSLVDPFWHTTTVYEITDLNWEMDRTMEGNVNLQLEGKKLEGGNSDSADRIYYEVTDTSGQRRDGGELYLGKYGNGDRFLAQMVLYGLTPGDSYQLRLSGSNE